MPNKSKSKGTDQAGGITHKKDMNAGSGAFNQGAEQDPAMKEKIPGSTPKPGALGKKKETPKAGNIGKNNAGGYE